jgi:hypothetical protein
MNSFLQGKKALSIPQLRPLHAAARPPGPPAVSLLPREPASLHAHSNGGDPTVEVVKEGDKIIRLVVVCTCGERVEIECLYPAGS